MKTLEIVGPAKAGKKTIAGQLLYQLNGVDLESLQVLETRGKAKYDQILPVLRELHKTPLFYTPSFKVAILDSQRETTPADGLALVLSPDTINDDVGVPAGKLTKGPIICILNKIDSIHGSEQAFRDFTQVTLQKLESLGLNTDQIPLIPVSGSTGENVVVTPEKLPWTLEGQKVTLVQCLDRTLAP